MNRKLRLGMVGGGTDAFIGAVHRLGAFMDGQIELWVAAVLASTQRFLFFQVSYITCWKSVFTVSDRKCSKMR